MKLVTYRIDSPFGSQDRVGVLWENEYVLDAISILEYFLRNEHNVEHANGVAQAYVGSDMLQLIQGGEGSLSILKNAVNYVSPIVSRNPLIQGKRSERLAFRNNEVALQSPLKPTSIRDGLNCLEHFKNLLKIKNLQKVPELFTKRPFYYRGSHTSISGPDSVIKWPSYGEYLDYELEILAIIGKEGENISTEEAMSCVFGYTIFNDYTARNQQPEDAATTLGPSKCKCFTGANVIGPCIVTADEIDPHNLTMVARVNGEVWSHNSTSEMLFRFGEMISYISQDEKLYPGECIGSGTMSFGAGIEMNRRLHHGDVIELEVDGIGVLRSILS